MEPDRNGAENSPNLPRRPAIWRIRGLVFAITAFGLALRLWGIGWSLPDARHPLATFHPDELVNLNAAAQADIAHGKFDIGFYNYGAFYFYLVSFAQTFGRGYHLIPQTPIQTNASLSETAALAQQAPEQAGLFLAGRLVTALLGTATIAVIFALGNRLYGKKVGVVSALLYAIAPLAVVHAHFLTVDVPATFFVALVLLWGARLLAGVTWKDAMLAGVWCGLAAATKYNTVLVIVAPLVALFLAFKSSRVRTGESKVQPIESDPDNHIPASDVSRWPSLQIWQQYLLHAGAVIAVTSIVFLIACPGPWLNWNAFWNGQYQGSGVRYELFEHARTGHGTLFDKTGPGWWYHLVVSLRYGLGLPLLALALAGVGFAIGQRKPADLVLLGFVIIFYLATGFSAVRFARYLIPIYPALCVLAAQLATHRFRADLRVLTVLYASCGIVVTFYTAVYTCCLVHAMSQPDPRDVAANYLEKNAPQGASIAFARIPWFFSPPLSPLWGALPSGVRARSADDTSRFVFRIPTKYKDVSAPDRAAVEWDTALLNPLPDYVILSNFETNNDIGRLKMERPTQFVDSVQRNFRPVVFSPAYVPGISPATEPIPEDLLYILPVITVYHN